MASRKENLKALFANTRSRLIIIVTISVLAIGFLVGFIRLEMASKEASENSGANLVNAPGGIQSIPGALNQTAQYAALQNTQNIQQANQALQTGGSAIPTIIRAQAFGAGVESVGPQGGKGSVGFLTLAREDIGGPQKSLWLQDLKNNQCAKVTINKVVAEGATLSDIKDQCSCAQLQKAGYGLKELKPICGCGELRVGGASALQLKAVGFKADELRQCGYTACEERAAGFSAADMKSAGFSDGELKGAGFNDKDLARAGGIPDGMTEEDVRRAGCQLSEIKRLRASGVSAAAIRRVSGCSPALLAAAGFSAQDLKNAGFTDAAIQNALKAAGRTMLPGCDRASLLKDKADGMTAIQIQQKFGCSDQSLAAVGFSTSPDCSMAALQQDLKNGMSADDIKQKFGCSGAQLAAAGFTDLGTPAGCDVASLQKDRQMGMTASQIEQKFGCSANELAAAGFNEADLKRAGFLASELRGAGVDAAGLRALGYSAKDLAQAGFSPEQLKKAGYNAQQLKDAGFSAAELKKAGFSAEQLKAAGYSAKDLKDAGFPLDVLRRAGVSAKGLRDAGVNANALGRAGYSDQDLQSAGFSPDESAVAGLDALSQAASPPASSAPGVTTLPPIGGPAAVNANNSTQQLQATLARQQAQMADQRFQQKLQQRTSGMLSAASQAMQGWKQVSQQVYLAGQKVKDKADSAGVLLADGAGRATLRGEAGSAAMANVPSVIKTGDILFAVIDTSVNSDEPGPILATIVSGKLKGSKLIGSFNLPSNADKMIITFNTLSIPGEPKTISINAFAIDPDTARTALSSETNHHYLMRYGSLFASTFIEGFGNAFQSADTTITIGGTGGTTDTTVQNGIGRSLLENAVIGLATVGKSWGQYAQQNMSRPTTVLVYSGTGVGVLFTQDVKSL